MAKIHKLNQSQPTGQQFQQSQLQDSYLTRIHCHSDLNHIENVRNKRHIRFIDEITLTSLLYNILNSKKPILQHSPRWSQTEFRPWDWNNQKSV